MNENGHKEVNHVHYQWIARLMPSSADGQQWKIRLIAIGQYPDGPREVASCVLEVWEGGVEMIRELAPGMSQLARELAIKQIGGIITRA